MSENSKKNYYSFTGALHAERNVMRLKEVLRLSQANPIADAVRDGLDLIPDDSRDSLQEELRAITQDVDSLFRDGFDVFDESDRKAANQLAAMLHRVESNPNLHKEPIKDTDTDGLAGKDPRAVLRCEGHTSGAFIKPGKVATFVADGGCGKSRLLQQILDAIARGYGTSCGFDLCSGMNPETEEINGEQVVTKGHRVCFVAAEEDESDLRERAELIAPKVSIAKRNASPSEPWAARTNATPNADTESEVVEEMESNKGFSKKMRYCLLEYTLLYDKPNGERKRVEATSDWNELWKLIEKHKPVLVVIDSASITFGGENNEKGDVLAFIAACAKKARKHGCAIILVLHTRKMSRSQDADPLDPGQIQGSTAWPDHSRSAGALSFVSDKLYEKLQAMGITEPQADLRLLGIIKCNTGVSGIVRLLKTIRNDPENGDYEPARFEPIPQWGWCWYNHSRAIKKIGNDGVFLSPLIRMNDRDGNVFYNAPTSTPADNNNESSTPPTNNGGKKKRAKKAKGSELE